MLYTSTYRVVCVNYISINWKEINLMYNLQKKRLILLRMNSSSYFLISIDTLWFKKKMISKPKCNLGSCLSLFSALFFTEIPQFSCCSGEGLEAQFSVRVALSKGMCGRVCLGFGGRSEQPPGWKTASRFAGLGLRNPGPELTEWDTAGGLHRESPSPTLS